MASKSTLSRAEFDAMNARLALIKKRLDEINTEKKTDPILSPKIETTLPPSSKLILVDMENTTFRAFLEKKFQESIKINDKEVLVAAEHRDKDLMIRIENFRNEKMTEDERLVNTADSILQSIKTNPIIRAFFRKDTTRQTLHEKAQIEWIQKNQYSDAVKMSAGTNGTCLAKNKFHVISKTNPRPSDATKTFDMHVPSKKIFAVLKHTSCPGGAQDNQYADVKHFISQAVGYLSDNSEAEEIFAAYLDGAYYTPKKVKELEDMIPAAHKGKILITNCASILSKGL
jgi:hypothetical protein